MGLGRLAVLFYYSKFYEVVDSIILAMKGKPVSNLQSYHHGEYHLDVFWNVK